MKIGIKTTQDGICLNKVKPTDDFTILEIDEQYSDCQPIDFNLETLEFSVAKYNARKQLEENQNRIVELKHKLAKYKEDVEQVELFGMERADYEEKKTKCAEIILELRQLEREV